MPQSESCWKALLLVLTVCLFCTGIAEAYYVPPDKYGDSRGDVCVVCHREVTPGIYNQWNQSAMGQAGVNCYDCHKAGAEDADGYEHKERIAIVPTPKDCGQCHEKEYGQYTNSHHADAIQTLESIDNFLGQAMWGIEDQYKGCEACHGTVVKLQKDGSGRLDPDTWPNTGIGRINLDGSKGACTACHPRHLFSTEQSRRPDTCGRCHNGPENPHIEIYRGSKHGMTYAAYQDRLNMDRRRWRAGVDYFHGPTCAGCHMGDVPPQRDVKDADRRLEEALKTVLSGTDNEVYKALLPPPQADKRIDLGVNHDVGLRLSWNLRKPIAFKQENWESRRKTMQHVCRQCHADDFIKQFYTQFDDFVERYNQTIAEPATRIRDDLIKQGKSTAGFHDEPLDRIYVKLVYHEGRRARHGAAMMGPAYAWSKGLQEVADRYYLEFIPEVRKILGRKAKGFLSERGYHEPQYRERPSAGGID